MGRQNRPSQFRSTHSPPSGQHPVRARLLSHTACEQDDYKTERSGMLHQASSFDNG